MTLADGFRKHGKDSHAGVERGIGILEDHLEVEPTFADFVAAEAGEFFAIEEDVSTGGWLELHHGAREGGFATP